jgi:hypothetical protein
LFVGDSTMRGVMYHLIEKINGTLTTDDKTHDFKLYNDVNDGLTSVGFSYYPRFWLPPNQRPVFDEALYHVLLK